MEGDEAEMGGAGPSTAVPARLAWTFLTNHAHVLFCLADAPADSGVRVRDVATRVGITERAVQRILSELEELGYIKRVRVGRRSLYTVDDARPLRHAMESHRTVGDLLALIVTPP
jgi:Mn-dependent DtxR family transcriptional regulator